MTKKLKHPDGTEETVEGTPEEIAAYERALNEGHPSPKRKPPVLKGMDLEELKQWIAANIAEIRSAIERIPASYNVFWHTPWYQPLIQPLVPQAWCQFCQKFGCDQNHIILQGATVSDGTTSADLQKTIMERGNYFVNHQNDLKITS